MYYLVRRDCPLHFKISRTIRFCTFQNRAASRTFRQNDSNNLNSYEGSN